MKWSNICQKIPRVAWSFLDQGVVSMGNFLLNLALARTLAPSVYGTFAVLYLAMIGANTLHGSVVTYWINLAGANANATQIRKLCTAALAITSAWLLPLTLILAAACFVLHDFSLWLVTSFALGCWQLQETVRRALLCRMRYESAILPDALSYLGQAGAVFILHPKSLSTVFIQIALTSIAALVWQLALVGWQRVSFHDFKTYLCDSFVCGRYVVLANAVNAVAIQIPAWTLVTSAGQSGVAAFQALSNVISVSNPLLLGLGNHLIPAVAKAAMHTRSAARRVAARDGALAGSAVLLYLGVVALYPTQAMALMYGHHSKYLFYISELRIMTLGSFFYLVTTVINGYEAGIGRTATYMKSQVAALICLCVPGILFIERFGLIGAVVATSFASAIRATVIALLSYRNDHNDPSVLYAPGAELDAQPATANQ